MANYTFKAGMGKVVIDATLSEKDLILVEGTTDLQGIMNTVSPDEDEEGNPCFVSKTNPKDKLVFKSLAGNTLRLADNTGKIYKIKEGANQTYGEANVHFIGEDDVKGTFKISSATTGTVALWVDNVFNDVYVDDSFTTIDASGTSAATVIIGARDENLPTTIIGGKTNNQMWGYNANESTLVGNASAQDTFWFGDVDGKVTVKNYDTAKDSLMLYSYNSVIDFLKAYGDEKVGGSVVFINEKDKNKKLLLEGVTTLNGLNMTVASGVTYKVLSQDNLSYSAGAKVYDCKTLKVGGEISDEVAIWVNNEFNNVLLTDNVKTVDAGDTAAKMIVVGDLEAATTFIGGKKDNAFWGASAHTDTMIGNASAVDSFWFGSVDGNDKFQNAGAEDNIYLWGVSSAEVKSVVALTVKTDEEIMSLNNGQATLTIGDKGNTALLNGLTIMTNDGALFKYDKASNSLVKK